MSVLLHAATLEGNNSQKPGNETDYNGLDYRGSKANEDCSPEGVSGTQNRAAATGRHHVESRLCHGASLKGDRTAEDTRVDLTADERRRSSPGRKPCKQEKRCMFPSQPTSSIGIAVFKNKTCFQSERH